MRSDVVMMCFALGATGFNIRNCVRLYRDKVVKGFSPWTIAFYSTGNFWNIYFWMSLGQWFAVAGGVPMALTNAYWVGMAVYYHWRAAAAGGSIGETLSRIYDWQPFTEIQISDEEWCQRFIERVRHAKFAGGPPTFSFAREIAHSYLAIRHDYSSPEQAADQEIAAW